MSKYLILSDSPLIPTGFRNQSLLLVEHLVAEGNEVFWLAPSHQGMAIKGAVLPDGRKLDFTILPGGRHPHALDVLPQRLADIRPDIFYILLDSFMLFPDIINMNLPMPTTHWWPMHSALWFPSDGGFFPYQCELVLKKFDKPVAMSKWARDQVKKQFGITAEYIPHGIRLAQFYPLNDDQKKELRKKYGQQFKRDISKKFIVGCVARNQPRKFMDRLVKSFALFAKDKEDVLLLLHSDPQDPAQMFPINELLKRADCPHKAEWTGMNALTGYPDDKMYEVYNLFDVKLDTTSGEGFGVTIIEAMACEVPVLITDYTTSKEIVFDHHAGLPIKLLGEDEPLHDGKAESGITNQIVGGWGVERGVCDIKHAVTQLQTCYDDWKTGGQLLKEMGKNGRQAVINEYDYPNKVWPLWKKLFQRMLE